MTDTLLREKNQITLPGEVVDAAGLVAARDRISWRFESGEIRGRKLGAQSFRAGRIAQDRQSGLFFFDSDVTPEEAEAAALSANLDQE